MPDNKEVRVRIAPSPTGDPHVGTAYIALFYYVFAKKHGGKFILRIEDTDQVRAKSSSEGQIMSTLSWLGLKWDEGPDCGGAFGPYRQSERTKIYSEHANQLIAAGHAYRCFCTADRLEKMRELAKKDGRSTGYDRHCRGLITEEIEELLAQKIPSVIRLKMPTDGQVVFSDLLRGDISFEAERMDDQVLLKSDGFPTYHLANVVDDHLMKISHVIRAEEWISSTPKHAQLYKAFGWEAPIFVHMPLLRNSDQSKISKRKNPVSLTYYRRAGILPDALLNFLALMGWSYGGDREIFSIPEMLTVFDIKDITLGGPVFDLVKLTWLNQNYMHKMSESQFVSYIRDEIFSAEFLSKLKPLALERMSRWEQFVDNNSFFFNGALNYQHIEIVPSGKTKEQLIDMIDELLTQLDDLYDWEAPKIDALLQVHKSKTGWKPKDYFMTLRLVTTGRKDSPPLAESLEVIGREMVRFRLRDYIRFLQAH